MPYHTDSLLKSAEIKSLLFGYFKKRNEIDFKNLSEIKKCDVYSYLVISDLLGITFIN